MTDQFPAHAKNPMGVWIKNNKRAARFQYSPDLRQRFVAVALLVEVMHHVFQNHGVKEIILKIKPLRMGYSQVCLRKDLVADLNELGTIINTNRPISLRPQEIAQGTIAASQIQYPLP